MSDFCKNCKSSLLISYHRRWWMFGWYLICRNMSTDYLCVFLESIHAFKGCLVNSAQNQLGPILTWPKTNLAQLNNQLGPRYVPTRPKHDSCLFLYYFLPLLAPICLSIWFFSFFHELDYRMASRYKTLDWLEYEYVWLCSAVCNTK